MSPEPTLESIEVRGADFALFRLGAGERVALLLHGFPDDARSMFGLMQRLAQAGYTCFAPLLRGYGPSAPAPGGDYTLRTLALDLLDLTRALSPQAPVDLVGHDWGALIGSAAAALEPERFRRVVIMGVSPTRMMLQAIFTSPRQLRRSAYIFLFQLPWLPEWLLRRQASAKIDALWRAWSPGWEAPPGHLAAIKQTLGAPGTLPQALAYYRALLRSGPRHPLAYARGLHALLTKRVHAPTLLLAGEQDGCAGPECYARPELAFAVAPTIRMLPGCGHFLHLEQPERVGDEVLGFLSEA